MAVAASLSAKTGAVTTRMEVAVMTGAVVEAAAEVADATVDAV